MTPAQVAHIMALAKECGAITYTHRSSPHEAAVSFGPIAWAKFVEAALLAPQAEPVAAAQLSKAIDALHWIKALAGNPEAVWRKANETIASLSTPGAPTSVEPDERAVTANDVYTLIGHAEMLTHDGQTDMPQYLHELAARLAEQVGDPWLINRAKTLTARASKGTK